MFIDISGKKFNHLKVLERSDVKKPDRQVYWKCLCDCGKKIILPSREIRKRYKSCGCVGVEKLKNRKGDKNKAFKGDNVGYSALHRYVINIKIKPTKCEKCGVLTDKLDLSNNGKYDRNPENYEWLCRSCHRIKDFAEKKKKNLKYQKIIEGNNIKKLLFSNGIKSVRSLAILSEVNYCYLNKCVRGKKIISNKSWNKIKKFIAENK